MYQRARWVVISSALSSEHVEHTSISIWATKLKFLINLFLLTYYDLADCNQTKAKSEKWHHIQNLFPLILFLDSGGGGLISLHSDKIQHSSNIQYSGRWAMLLSSRLILSTFLTQRWPSKCSNKRRSYTPGLQNCFLSSVEKLQIADSIISITFI